jgi:hypothetical protein
MDPAAEGPVVVYVHGAGGKPPGEALKQAWDRDLFGRDKGQQTQMAHYANTRPDPPNQIGIDSCTQAEALAMLDSTTVNEAALLAPLTPEARASAIRLSISMAVRAASRPPDLDRSTTADESLLYSQLLRRLLLQVVSEIGRYVDDRRQNRVMWMPLQERLRSILSERRPVVVIGHDLGALIAYDVLSDPEFVNLDVELLITLGSPLGDTELQREGLPLGIPGPVRQWHNFLDPLDVVACDPTLAEEYRGDPRVMSTRVENPSPNHHAACGYLSSPQVRSAVADYIHGMELPETTKADMLQAQKAREGTGEWQPKLPEYLIGLEGPQRQWAEPLMEFARRNGWEFDEAASRSVGTVLFFEEQVHDGVSVLMRPPPSRIPRGRQPRRLRKVHFGFQSPRMLPQSDDAASRMRRWWT